MACFADINVSQGSVATYARCSGIFTMHLTANLPKNLPVKKFVSRLRFDRIMVMSLWPRFLAHPVCWGWKSAEIPCFNENLYLRAPVHTLSSLIRAKFGVWEWNVWSLFTHQISSGTVYSLALEGHKIWQNTAILTKLEMFEGALCPPSMPIKANLLCNSRIYNLCLHANYFYLDWFILLSLMGRNPTEVPKF